VWGALCDTACRRPGAPPEARRFCTLAAAEALGRLGKEAMERAGLDFMQASFLLSEGARTEQAGAVAGALAHAKERGDAELQAALLSGAEALMRHPRMDEKLFESRIMDSTIEGFADRMQNSSDRAVSQKAINLMTSWYSLIKQVVQTSPAGGENAGGQQPPARPTGFESPSKRRPSGICDENMFSPPNRLRTPQRTPGSRPPSAAGTPARLGGC